MKSMYRALENVSVKELIMGNAGYVNVENLIKA